MSAEVKNLASVMNTIAKTLEGLKEPPSIPGGSHDVLPPAPGPVFANPASPKISPPVLHFNLPLPGVEDRMEEGCGADDYEGDESNT